VFLVYRPDGGDEQRWRYESGKFRSAEMEAIEKRTSWDFDTAFQERLLSGNAFARRALLWTFLRRVHLAIRFEDVDFASEELVLEFDQAELEAQRAQVLAMSDIDERERSAALALLDTMRADAVEPEGKAPPSDVESATGSP
jgi:hypothetical protein